MPSAKKETERKFLVKNKDYRTFTRPVYFCQGYLNDDPERTVRIRTAGEKAYLTVKGKTIGISRIEYEYEIPVEDAEIMLKSLCLHPLIEKYRYTVPQGELNWEIDEFLGENEGLIIAEIELPDESYSFELPDWVGKEVSGDPNYYNVNLIKNPYKNRE